MDIWIWISLAVTGKELCLQRLILELTINILTVQYSFIITAAHNQKRSYFPHRNG